jgi:signal transduction histidine kinase
MPPPRTVPTDLRELVSDVLALYRAFPQVRVVTRLDGTLPKVRVDPEQFRRVVINLVDNAIEALGEDPAPPDGGGLVEVQAHGEATPGVVRLTVADNGPGLSEADRAKIFMPYYSTKKRGSGLGLAIVRRIVVEHGGSIEAADNVPRGTRMTIELPC